MGIVMTLAMLAGLVTLFKSDRSTVITYVVALCLLASGLWNALWYGLRHLGTFWGVAGIVTGLTMILVAFHLWSNRDRAQSEIRADYKWFLAGALMAGFLLYFITLVQLNLGYEIIR